MANATAFRQKVSCFWQNEAFGFLLLAFGKLRKGLGVESLSGLGLTQRASGKTISPSGKTIPPSGKMNRASGKTISPSGKKGLLELSCWLLANLKTLQIITGPGAQAVG